MGLAHQCIDQIVRTLLRQQEKYVARCLAIDAQEHPYDYGIRTTYQIWHHIEWHQRYLRHIHIYAPIDHLRQGRRRIAGTNIADFP